MMRCGTKSKPRKQLEKYNEIKQFLDLSCVPDRNLIQKSLTTRSFKILKLDFSNADDYFEALMSLKCDHLTELHLKRSNLRSTLFCQLMCKNLENLKQLRLDENNIGVKGIKMFQINELKNLEHLSMRNCSIGEEGAKILTKANFPKLRILCLLYNNLGLNGHLAILNIKMGTLEQIWTGEEKNGHYVNMMDNIAAMSYVAIQFQYAPSYILTYNDKINGIMKKRWKIYA